MKEDHVLWMGVKHGVEQDPRQDLNAGPPDQRRDVQPPWWAS